MKNNFNERLQTKNNFNERLQGTNNFNERFQGKITLTKAKTRLVIDYTEKKELQGKIVNENQLLQKIIEM